jgi:tetratricopeptide (TPR) repeat protein/serine/threonine protein kinase
MAADQRRIKELFVAALELPDSAARRRFLDRQCADDAELQHRVEALLQAHDAPASALDRPLAEISPAQPDPPSTMDAVTATEAFGSVIAGRYKLLEEIGEGGMGTVWMAQQTEPIKRLVAVKVIKPGMDSKQVIARFEAERQALALMDHPNIARVLDGGTTKGEPGGVGPGRPYFVMDLVKGVPITKYCDEHRLTPRHRLELFIPVCQAVQHAHQKGIIHRDLKPSNVLVALYDGKPVPKVIDFGVAKAAGQTLTEKTLVTGFGSLVGTLEYMSPEQAEINQLDIDTRSDIYSLGVLLYELLTGSPPFTRKESEKGGMLEMLRVIREQEPTRPSTKLSTAEGLPTLAANRGTEPAKLTKLMRGELDWIVMKALEKDRSRRYETANGFAQDLQRYLADEPVLACPPSVGYRFRKFARRNKVALAIAGLILSFLLLLGGGAGWALRDRTARQEETAHQASESLTRARKWMGENKLALARQELAEAKGRIRGDRAALHSLTEQIEALEAELEKFESFLSLLDQAHQAELPGSLELAVLDQSTKSTSQPLRWRERDPANAVPFLLQALSLYQIIERDDWLAVLEGGLLEPGQRMQIRSSAYEELLWLADDVSRRWEDHRSGQKLSLLDAARESLAYLRKAEETFRPTSAFYRLRAQCHKSLGETEEARADQALAEKTPAVIALDHYLPGLSAYAARNKAQGVKHFEAALRVEPTHYWSLMRLGYCLTDLGEQEQDFAAGAAAFSGCILKRPAHAHAYYCRGLAYSKMQRNEEALADYVKATELHPKHLTAWNARAAAHHQLAQLEKALAAYSKAIDLDPKCAIAWRNRGVTYHQMGEHDKAIADYSKVIELDPKDRLAWCWRGQTYTELGELNKALDDLSKTVDINPKIAETWQNRGTVYQRLNRDEEALADHTKAIQLDPGMAGAWNGRGGAYYRLRQYAKALANYAEAIKLDPKRAEAWANRGWTYLRLDQMEKALADFEKAIELDPRFAFAWAGRGCAHWDLRRPAEARADFEKAIELNPREEAALAGRGLSRLNLGDTDGALDDLTRAVQLDPKLPGAWRDLGRIAEMSGRWGKAICHYSKAIELDANQTNAWAGRGRAYTHLNRLDKALADHTKAIEVYDKGSLYWLERSVVYLKLKRPHDALADCTKAIELDDGKYAPAWLNRAEANWQLGRREQAADDYRTALSLNIALSTSDINMACSRFAEVLMADGKEEVTDFGREYIRTRSSDAQGLNNAAFPLATNPDPKFRHPILAAELARKAVEVSPKSSAFQNTLGVALYRTGDWKRSIAALETAVGLNGTEHSDNAFSFFFLAMARWQLDEKCKARDWLLKGVQSMEKHHPKNEELVRFRAEAMELMGVKDKKD